jgi:hypothetical protein
MERYQARPRVFEAVVVNRTPLQDAANAGSSASKQFLDESGLRKEIRSKKLAKKKHPTEWRNTQC